MPDLVQEIQAAAESLNRAHHNRLSQSYVKRWMETSDIHVLGSLQAFLATYGDRVVPELEQREYSQVFIKYWNEALRSRDVTSEWVGNPTESAKEITSYIHALVDKRDYDEIDFMLDWLAQMYLESDNALRSVLETGVFEHLLENEELKHRMAYWSSNPVLAIALQRTQGWSDSGKRTEFI